MDLLARLVRRGCIDRILRHGLDRRKRPFSPLKRVGQNPICRPCLDLRARLRHDLGEPVFEWIELPAGQTPAAVGRAADRRLLAPPRYQAGYLSCQVSERVGACVTAWPAGSSESARIFGLAPRLPKTSRVNRQACRSGQSLLPVVSRNP